VWCVGSPCLLLPASCLPVAAKLFRPGRRRRGSRCAGVGKPPTQPPSERRPVVVRPVTPRHAIAVHLFIGRVRKEREETDTGGSQLQTMRRGQQGLQAVGAQRSAPAPAAQPAAEQARASSAIARLSSIVAARAAPAAAARLRRAAVRQHFTEFASSHLREESAVAREGELRQAEHFRQHAYERSSTAEAYSLRVQCVCMCGVRVIILPAIYGRQARPSRTIPRNSLLRACSGSSITVSVMRR